MSIENNVHMSISLLTGMLIFSTLVNSAAICLANLHIHMKETTRCVLSMAMACVLMCGTGSETGDLLFSKAYIDKGCL